MDLEKLRVATYYMLKEFIGNLRGNMGMILVAMLTIALSMFIIGTFAITYLNFRRVEAKLLSYIKIHAYLKDDLPDERVKAIIDEIRKLPNVIDVNFISKDKVFERAMRGLKIELRRKIIYNPMPDMLEVSISSPNYVEEVARAVSSIEGVEDVEYWQKYLSRLRRFLSAAEKASTLVTLLALIASGFIISNTIRLTVLARQREIKIMELVGAARWFIRIPLMMEGLIVSLAGASLAIIFLSLVYVRIYAWFSVNAELFNFIAPSELGGLWGVLLLLSALMGLIGSFLAIESSLKELRKESTG